MKVILTTNDGIILGEYENVEDELFDSDWPREGTNFLADGLLHEAELAVENGSVKLEAVEVEDDFLNETFTLEREVDQPRDPKWLKRQDRLREICRSTEVYTSEMPNPAKEI